jgi:Ankyrin repeat
VNGTPFFIFYEGEGWGKDPYGFSPLVSALEKNHFDVAALLLSNGADPNSKDVEGDRVLPALVGRIPEFTDRFRSACQKGDLDRARMLVGAVASLARWSPRAAEALVEWSQFAKDHKEPAEQIHNALMKYWEEEENPPEVVALYAAQHYAADETDRLEAWFAEQGLSPKGGLKAGSFAFVRETNDYSSNDHGLEAVHYARAWALNPYAPMWRALDILTFVANQAIEQKASLDALRGAVGELRAQLLSIPAFKERADELEKQLPAIFRDTQ